MAKFITGEELEKVISQIIWDAKDKLLIVSPFIKLDEYFIKIFEKQIPNSQLHLIVVFGKNEHDRSKSLNANDFDFFKRFPCVSIVYVPNLHAKYYGNESKGVITSINMYDHSFKNNIEFGVFSENNLLDKLTHSSDQEAWNKCHEIAENGEPVFIKRPVFKKKLISILGKDYINSLVLLDKTDTLYLYNNRVSEKRKLLDFSREIDFEEQTNVMPSREDISLKSPNAGYNTSANVLQQYGKQEAQYGYCIRTGVKITFNPARPFSVDAYRNWAQFQNWDYSENYCHKTGKRSYGKTSMRNPIL